MKILPKRFLDKVKPAGACHEWTAAKTNNGYGRFKHNGKTMCAHRFVYEFVIGPIPDGMQLDHLCRNRGCVNLAHLEVVTPRQNVLRGQTITAVNHRKTHCIWGHELLGGNLFIRKNGSRMCRACKRRDERKLRSTPEYKKYHAAYEYQRRHKHKEQE